MLLLVSTQENKILNNSAEAADENSDFYYID